VTILLPELSQARALARATVCQHRLHELSAAFRAASAAVEKGLDSPPYPLPESWPEIPGNVVPQKEIYRCPESEITIASVECLLFRSTVGGEKWTDFAEGEFCLVEQGEDSTLYRFEDWIGGDFDYNDAVIRIYDGPPMYGEIVSCDTGAANELWRSGQMLWPEDPDPRHHVGGTFKVGGGETNYGINGALGGHHVGPHTVVLLDYDRLIANDGEDVAEHLRASARHLGRLNALFADDSVRRLWPDGLDPAVSTNAPIWRPDR